MPLRHDDLEGLPYVECVTDPKPSAPTVYPLQTTSLSEGHRIASDYFVSIKDKPTILGGENDGQVFRHVLRREELVWIGEEEREQLPLALRERDRLLWVLDGPQLGVKGEAAQLDLGCD